MKFDTTTILILVVVFLFLTGSIAIPQVDLNEIFGGDGAGDKVPVNKNLDFAVMDKYAGSNVGSVVNGLTIYRGTTQLEQLSIGADGTISTAYPYASGDELNVLYKNTNSKQWFVVTVPEMNEDDAESLTVNPITLWTFSVTSGTDALRFGATSISDAGSYNFTASGTTPTFTYDYFTTSDNKGFMSSYDPIYQMGYYGVVYISFSGTGYETVIPYGFDNDFTLGTTHWVASRVSDTDLVKYKVGNSYVHKGEMHFQFNLDGTGYSGTGTTMQLYLKIYSDPAYMKSHGANFGPEVVELAEQTVTLQS